MSVINALYDGKLYPAEQIVPEDPEYTDSNRKVDTIMKKLEQCLDAGQYDMVEELCDLLANSQDILSRESFRYGLSLGLRMMQEASAVTLQPLAEV